MTTNAKLYITVILVLGMSVLMMAFTVWQLASPVSFAAFFTLAVAASTLRVAVPEMAGRMPLNCLFVLVALYEFSLPEALLVGCTSVLIECVWCRRGAATALDAYFSMASMALAIGVSNRIILLLVATGLPDWVVIPVTTLVFFSVNTFPSASVMALAQRRAVLSVWRGHMRVLPLYLLSGLFALGFHRATVLAGWTTALILLPLTFLLFRTYALYLGRIEDEKVHAEELAALHLRTIESLALAIEANDDTTGDHLKRVQVYAVALGSDLGMRGDELEALRAAAVLHDIGKLAVPEYIISKPGRLTPEEFEKMKVHPVVGAEILEHVQFPYPVAPIVRAHHEKWNGKGYPDGLAGTDIPLGGRILAAVDALDALASDRQYRRALPLDEAMAKIEAESGQSFDPDVVRALKGRYQELEKSAQSARSSGLKLSTALRFGDGAAPAAGYASTSAVPALEPRPRAADLIEGIAQTRHDVQVLFESNLGMGVDEMCSVLTLRLQRVVPFDAIAVYLVREGVLSPAYVYGDNHRLFSSLRIPVGQGLSGWVVENGKPIVNGNPAVESGYLNNPAIISTLGSALALPLEGSDGQIFGVIALYGDARDSFGRDHFRLMQSIVPRLALGIEHALHHGRTDITPEDGGLVLDGVSLLRYIDEELQRLRRLNSPMGLVVCSVNNLAGLSRVERERVLRAVLNAMEHGAREYEKLARTAENEFVLVAPGASLEAVERRAVRVGQVPLPVSTVTVSVSHAAYPMDGSTPDELLKAADRRLFSNKLRGPVVPDSERGLSWVQ